MKNTLKYLIVFFLAAFTVSCEDEDKNPFDVAALDNGAVLRTIAIKSGSIDLFNLNAAKFEVELEFFAGGEGQDNSLLESVDVFLRFRDNTSSNGTNDVAELLLRNIPASAFQEGPSGFPRTTLIVTAGDALSALGLEQDEIDGGDIVAIRLALKLTTGQVFSSENRSGDLPGPFFASPFAYDAPIVCNLPTTLFTGSYQATIIEDGNPFGPSIPEGVYTITSTSPTRRTMPVDWIGPGGFPFTMIFDLVCGRTVVPNQQSGGGVGCGGGAITMSTEIGSEGSFDANDDSSFILEFRDFVADGGCGVSPPPTIIVQFDKIQ